MKRVGELIQEAIDTMSSGAFESAFAVVCAAMSATLRKTLETDTLSKHDYQSFIRQNGRLLAFVGLPRALPLPPDIDAGMKKIVHGFYLNGGEELVIHIICQTALMERLPAHFKFHSGMSFEIRNNQIFLPKTLIGGLMSVVVFQPANKDETVPDNYWMTVLDFKMFISELWGRMDLGERIINLR